MISKNQIPFHSIHILSSIPFHCLISEPNWSLGVLRKHELYVKLKKCEFWLKKVVLLGHVVSKKGISVDPQKIEATTQYPKSKNAIEVRSFLGSVGYYCKFVQNFSRITGPSLTWQRRSQAMNGPTNVRKPFQELKKRLTSASILTWSGNKEHFMVYSDASSGRLGCVLMQGGRVRTYASLQLTPHERNYSTMIWSWQ